MAADVLGHSPSAAVIERLQAALSDPQASIRGEIYEALARSGDRTLMPVLIRAAAKESDTAARQVAERSAEYLAAGPPSPTEAEEALTQLSSSSAARKTSATRTLATSKEIECQLRRPLIGRQFQDILVYAYRS